jgi:hypothetical protein
MRLYTQTHTPNFIDQAEWHFTGTQYFIDATQKLNLAKL